MARRWGPGRPMWRWCQSEHCWGVKGVLPHCCDLREPGPQVREVGPHLGSPVWSVGKTGSCLPPQHGPGTSRSRRNALPDTHSQRSPQSRLWLQSQRKSAVEQRCFPLRAGLLWVPEAEGSASTHQYQCCPRKSGSTESPARAQLYPTLCDPMDCSPPGSSAHGIFQARILEGVAISFSRRSSWPRDPTCCPLHWQADSLPWSSPGKPTLKSGVDGTCSSRLIVMKFRWNFRIPKCRRNATGAINPLPYNANQRLPCGSDGEESARNVGVPVWSLGQEDPLEKRMATHSSILSWRIPWTEKPGGLQSMGSQRVRETEQLTLSTLSQLLGCDCFLSQYF